MDFFFRLIDQAEANCDAAAWVMHLHVSSMSARHLRGL